jgi:hypothetical protein
MTGYSPSKQIPMGRGRLVDIDQMRISADATTSFDPEQIGELLAGLISLYSQRLEDA